MESLKELATVFCAVCLLSGGLGLISGGVLKNSVGYILSLILLLSVVTALAKTGFELDIESKRQGIEASHYEEAMSEYQAEYICEELLREAGVAYEKVLARANKTDNGGIIINEIIIKGASSKEDAEKAIIESGICDRVRTE